MQKYITCILTFIMLVIMQLTNPLKAIVWDSSSYSDSEAHAYAASKVWKIRNGDCSAVKVKSKWIATAAHCTVRSWFSQSGQTFSVVKNEEHPTADIRLYKVDDILPTGRKVPTASNIQIGDRFKKLGKGGYGRVTGNDISNYVVPGTYGIWRGGRNEIDSIGTDRTLSRVRYTFDQNYINEVGIWDGDSGGPAVIVKNLVGTTSGTYPQAFSDVDWTRLEDWWSNYF